MSRCDLHVLRRSSRSAPLRRVLQPDVYPVPLDVVSAYLPSLLRPRIEDRMNALKHSSPIPMTSDYRCIACGEILASSDYDEGRPAFCCVSCDEALHEACQAHDHCRNILCAEMCPECEP